MRRCVLIGAMECEDDLSNIREDDYVVLVDGGYRYNSKLNADLIIGDFDSLGYVPAGDNVIKHPVKKDDTDMMLAVRQMLSMDFDEYLLLGGIGGRIDHLIANIQTLAYLKSKHKRAIMIGDGQELFIIENETVKLPKRDKGIVSVFAYGDVAHNVTIEGLLYEVKDVDLTSNLPLGVSNHFKGTKGKISAKDGRLLIIINNSDD